MGLFYDLLNDVKHQATNTLRNEARHATRGAIQNAIDAGVNKVATTEIPKFCPECGADFDGVE